MNEKPPPPPRETTTPSVDFLLELQKACDKGGFPFAQTFDTYFTRGYVFKGPDFLMLGERDPDRDDAWLVFWAHSVPQGRTIHNIGRFLRMMPYHLPYVGFARGLRDESMKVRYYLTDRLLRLTEVTTHGTAAVHPFPSR